jgi:hypothetical protein
MKKIKTIFASAFVMGVLAMNLSVVTSSFTSSTTLSFLNQAFASNGEADIICNSGGSGVCYVKSGVYFKKCDGELQMGWGCSANGDPSSYCQPYTPC